MDSGNVSAIISACAGIAGVLLGNSFLTIKEVFVSYFKRKKNAEYLAIIVVSHLERFATGCLHVAYDDGTVEGRPAGNGGNYWAATTEPPIIQPLDIQVEWKSLPRDLMHSVLRIPDNQEYLSHQLSGIYDHDDFPEHAEYFRARRYGYAKLGLDVLEVAKKLRRHAGITTEKGEPDDWNRELALREIMKNITEARAEAEKRLAEYRKAHPQPGFPSTQ